MKRIVSIILFLACLFSLSCSAYADNTTTSMEAVDSPAYDDGTPNKGFRFAEPLTDKGLTRGNYVPTSLWNLSEKSYSSPFTIEYYTYTGSYFLGNSDGQIFYSITDGKSQIGDTCTVETYCKTCNYQISTHSFDPNGAAPHRVITLNSHKEHYIYFKIVAATTFYFDINDFSGNFNVGHSYV